LHSELVQIELALEPVVGLLQEGCHYSKMNADPNPDLKLELVVKEQQVVVEEEEESKTLYFSERKRLQ